MAACHILRGHTNRLTHTHFLCCQGPSCLKCLTDNIRVQAAGGARVMRSALVSLVRLSSYVTLDPLSLHSITLFHFAASCLRAEPSGQRVQMQKYVESARCWKWRRREAVSSSLAGWTLLFGAQEQWGGH